MLKVSLTRFTNPQWTRLCEGCCRFGIDGTDEVGKAKTAIKTDCERMINNVMSLLKNRLNGYIQLKTDRIVDHVQYIPGSRLEPLSFPIDVITPILINIEEDRTIRKADPFEGLVKDGVRSRINPAIHINLIVLFVSKFEKYDQGLQFLDYVIRYFQFNRQFNHRNAPELEPSIHKLIVELLSMPLVQQNELWNALRTSYIPSVAYRIRMLVYNDEETLELVEQMQEAQINAYPINESGGKFKDEQHEPLTE